MSSGETKFARSGDTHIAYQVLGSGPLDLVLCFGWVSHIELALDDPLHGRFLRRLASFARLILFDKRGTGLSDRVSVDKLPTLEERMDDLRAVMDAAGSPRAAIFGVSEGGPLSAMFAAAHPDRTIALAMYGTYAKRIASADYPWAPTLEQTQSACEAIERDWGRMKLKVFAPSKADDAQFMRDLNTYCRSSASPGAAVALMRMNSLIDIREVVRAIRVPTLVLHRAGDRLVHLEEGRWLAAQVAGAKFVELAGDDHFPWVGDQDAIVSEVQEFLTGVRPASEWDRVLATVLFLDICDSTGHASRLGDRAWRELLERFQAVVRRSLDRYRGREIDTAGDGFFATFDGPARAVRCACAVRADMRALGLEIRGGVHTGEVEAGAGKPTGIAVHIAARIVASAGRGEVLASGTVRDLVHGSGIEFAERGVHALKGVPGQWPLFAAA